MAETINIKDIEVKANANGPYWIINTTEGNKYSVWKQELFVKLKNPGINHVEVVTKGIYNNIVGVVEEIKIGSPTSVAKELIAKSERKDQINGAIMGMCLKNACTLLSSHTSHLALDNAEERARLVSLVQVLAEELYVKGKQ